MEPTANPEPHVQIRDLSKAFAGVQALASVRFEVRPGEVHAVVGENGAGKSTLMKVLAGIYQRDSGDIIFDGRPVEIPSPRAAQALGIQIIHQELNLMNHLTAAQNMFIGREPRGRFGLFLDEKRLNAQAAAIFERMHLTLDPRTPVGELTVARQQMVEIAKALSFDSRLLIMDEPTAALNNAEIAELFRIIRKLKAQGVGVVYISHKMDELKQISDRVTVMRDGQYIATLPTDETPLETIIAMMVGRKLSTTYDAPPDTSANPVVMEVRGLARGKEIRDVSFDLRRGEILGIAGLVGSGRTELARCLFGADVKTAGTVVLDGKPVNIDKPRDAIAAGIGLVPEDRKQQALFLDLAVRENLSITALGRLLRLGFVRADAESALVERYRTALNIRMAGAEQKAKNLSGGNQQKVVLARWLALGPRILIVDEPTRGIDVGAKAEVHQLLHEMAMNGIAILAISSELPEVLAISDRILTMRGGRISGEVSKADATEQKLMSLMTVGEAKAA